MREKKKIVLYFGKKRKSLDPFKNFGSKRQVYYDLFEKGVSSGLEMFVSSGRKFYFGNLVFGNILKYENGKFKHYVGKIKADAVYDRSGGITFPDVKISKKVLNGIEFKKLCADKMLTYKFIGEFMPESFSVTNKKELKKKLADFKDQLVVLKPLNDFGGKGICIGTPEEVGKCKLIRGHKYKLQRFVETSAGIPGIVKGRHDLRIIIVHGRAVMAHVRKPSGDGFLANVAQGGTIKEVFLEKIPNNIIMVALEIQKKIDKLYGKPIYSIDLGVMDGKPYVFELNDQIGFPSEEMEKSKNFVEALVEAMIARTKR